MIDVRQKVLCNNGDMQLAMVLAGHGIARLPGFYMEQALQDNRLVVLFESCPSHEIDVYVVYPSRKHLSPKVRAFIDLAAERLSDKTTK